MVFHSGNVPSPAELIFQQHGFDAGNLRLFKDLDICDEVTPVNVKNSAETALVKTFEKAHMAAVDDPCLGAVEKGGENYGPVYANLRFVLQVLVVPDSLVESAE